MQVTFDGQHPVVRQAVERANELLKDANFLKAIADHPQFDMSDATPAMIAELILTSQLEFAVELFTPRGPRAVKYRKTFAYTDSAHPNRLFLNEKKIDREVADIAATIVHEGIHALDDAEDDYSFGHGNNRPRGKENTAPYWIGNLAYQLLTNQPDEKAPSVDEVEEH